MTDREKVPRGNVEKSTEMCSEKSEKSNILKQSNIRRTFCIMGQQLNVYSEPKMEVGGVGKLFIIIMYIRPETKWSNHEQVEEGLKSLWRTEPVSVEIDWDDLWLGVKG